jgi:hypothetical protein
LGSQAMMIKMAYLIDISSSRNIILVRPRYF